MGTEAVELLTRHQVGALCITLAELEFGLHRSGTDSRPSTLSRAPEATWLVDGYFYCSVRSPDLSFNSKINRSGRVPCGVLAHRAERLKTAEYALLFPDLPNSMRMLVKPANDAISSQVGVLAGLAPHFLRLRNTLHFHSIDTTDVIQPDDLISFILGVIHNSSKDRITIAGHGIGAAVGACLAVEIGTQTKANLRIQTCFIGAPKVGTTAFIDALTANVKNPLHISYERDLVRYYPDAGPIYASLENTEILSSASARATIADNPAANHDAICYAAMLDHSLVRGGNKSWQELLVQCGRLPGYIVELKPMYLRRLASWIYRRRGRIWSVVQGVLSYAARGIDWFIKSLFEHWKPAVASAAGVVLGATFLIHVDSPPVPIEVIAPVAGRVDDIPSAGSPVSPGSVLAKIDGRPPLFADKNTTTTIRQQLHGACLIDRNDLARFRSAIENVNASTITVHDNGRFVINAARNFDPYHKGEPNDPELFDGVEEIGKMYAGELDTLSDYVNQLRSFEQTMVDCDNREKYIDDFLIAADKVNDLFPVEIHAGMSGTVDSRTSDSEVRKLDLLLELKTVAKQGSSATATGSSMDPIEQKVKTFIRWLKNVSDSPTPKKP